MVYLYGPQRLPIGPIQRHRSRRHVPHAWGNHPLVGPSTYPFTMFGGVWTEATIDVFQTLPSQATQSSATTSGSLALVDVAATRKT